MIRYSLLTFLVLISYCHASSHSGIDPDENEQQEKSTQTHGTYPLHGTHPLSRESRQFSELQDKQDDAGNQTSNLLETSSPLSHAGAQDAYDSGYESDYDDTRSDSLPSTVKPNQRRSASFSEGCCQSKKNISPRAAGEPCPRFLMWKRIRISAVLAAIKKASPSKE